MSRADRDGTDDYWEWSSLRELDTATGRDKGSAFRVFKRLLPGLIEDQDFTVLDHQTRDGLAARWQAADRLYRGSINPVLLSPAAAKKIIDALHASAGG